MISSLSIPSFPAGLIKNPELLEAINKRHKELLEIRKKLFLEEQRIREITEMLEEMEQRQREAELKRLAAQSREWVHDLVPRGSAMFGSEPSFKSDFHIDPEEARAQVASRRASRLQSRESSVTPGDVLPSGSCLYCKVLTECNFIVHIFHSQRFCQGLRGRASRLQCKVTATIT